jgi:hypothetical protein
VTAYSYKCFIHGYGHVSEPLWYVCSFDSLPISAISFKKTILVS